MERSVRAGKSGLWLVESDLVEGMAGVMCTVSMDKSRQGLERQACRGKDSHDLVVHGRLGSRS
jgi:hypothetical protein